MKLNAPTYDRFARKNNIGMLLPVNTSSSIYLDAGIEGWIEANKYIQENNDSYSVGFFGSCRNSHPDIFGSLTASRHSGWLNIG